ncbi:MAG: T9SS type A sorting domain-containing protein [Bacteroidales bacterium]|nr:T9SS type A sorting domain-containing protein [Bacteroidales bacterium]
MKHLLRLIVLFYGIPLFAQIQIGTWRTHLSYNQAIEIAITKDKIYALTTGGLFEFNKTDNSVRKLDKVYGLSDVTIQCIQFIPEKKSLVIGYDNGNIDIIKQDRIINISDIKNKQMIGNKAINCIKYYQGQVYLGCGFGIVVIDIDKYEVKETYMIGPNATNVDVQSITFDNQRIYAATTKGIYSSSYVGVNLANYQNWILDQSIPNYDKHFRYIEYFNQKLFAVYKSLTWGNDKLYIFENNQWNAFADTALKNIRSMHVTNNKLIICDQSIIRVMEAGMDSFATWYFQDLYPNYAAIDEYGDFWIGDTYGGMVWKKKNSANGQYIWIKPNGPLFNDVMRIDCASNNVWATAGGLTGTLNNQWKGAAMYHFKDQEWKFLYQYSVPQLQSVYDVCFVKINPQNPREVYFGSYGSGLIKVIDNHIDTIFNQNNSPLETIIPNQPYVRITGLDFDTDGNLWIMLSEVTNNLAVLKKDGTWQTFALSVPMGGKKISGNILCTTKGVKWIILPKGNGLFAFSENGTLQNTTDDKYKKVSVVSSEGEEISNDVFCIKEDKDGLLWVGTAKGLVYYYNQESVFDNANFYAQRIKLPNEIEGQANYLFESEVITALAIDGANRKWIGTLSGGVFLMSEDCTKELLHFTTENSPLLSNTISDIAIDPASGEVFFATEKGICSYRSTATEGKEFHYQVEVFPNPVKSDYFGIIAIRGLVENAFVKITDVAGNLVYETQAHGGQAVWNGKTYSGKRVQTGVYFVFSTNENGSETFVAKILVVN